MKNISRLFYLIPLLFCIFSTTNAYAVFFVEFNPSDTFLSAEITDSDDDYDVTPILDDEVPLFVKIRNDASRWVGTYIYQYGDGNPQIIVNGDDDKFIGPSTDVVSLGALHDVIAAWSLSLDALGGSRTYFFPVPRPDLQPGEEVRFRIQIVGPAAFKGVTVGEDDPTYDLLMQAMALTLFDKVVAPVVGMTTGAYLDADKLLTLWGRIGMEFIEYINLNSFTLMPMLDNGDYYGIAKNIITWTSTNKNFLNALAEVTAISNISDLFKYLGAAIGHWMPVLDAANAINNLMSLSLVNWDAGATVSLSCPLIEGFSQGEEGTVIIQGKGFDPYVKGNNKIYLGDSLDGIWQEVAEENFQVGPDEDRIVVDLFAEGFTEGDIRLSVSGLWSNTQRYEGCLLGSELTIEEPLDGQIMSGPDGLLTVAASLLYPPDPFLGGEATLKIDGIKSETIQITESEFTLQNTLVLDPGEHFLTVDLEITNSEGQTCPITSTNQVKIYVPGLEITSPVTGASVIADTPFALSAELTGLPDPVPCTGDIFFKLYINDEYRPDLESQISLGDELIYSQSLSLPQESYDIRLNASSYNMLCDEKPSPNIFIDENFTLNVVMDTGTDPVVTTYPIAFNEWGEWDDPDADPPYKPSILAYANTAYIAPPDGVTITVNDNNGAIWTLNQWLALLYEGQSIEAACSTATTSVGVYLSGDFNDGLARILVDEIEVWSGDTYYFQGYIDISGLNNSPHTVRVENMGGVSGRTHTCIYFFGFGPVSPLSP